MAGIGPERVAGAIPSKKKKKPEEFGLGAQAGLSAPRPTPTPSPGPMPRVVQPQIPVTPNAVALDENLRRFAVGYRNATGNMPSPEKVAEFALEDEGTSEKEWTGFFSQLLAAAEANDTVAGGGEYTTAHIDDTMGDFFYKGPVTYDAPWYKDADLWIGEHLIATQRADVYVAQEEERFRKLPEVRNLENFFDLKSLRHGKFKPSEKAGGEFGLISAELEKQGFTGTYGEKLRQWVIASSWADAVWLRDPRAIQKLNDLGALPPGTNPRRLLKDTGLSGEGLKEFTFDTKFRTKPPDMTDTEFMFWYDRTYQVKLPGSELVVTGNRVGGGTPTTSLSDTISYTPKVVKDTLAMQRENGVGLIENALSNFGIDIVRRGNAGETVIVLGKDKVSEKPAWKTSYYPQVDGSIGETIDAMFAGVGKAVAEPFVITENALITLTWLIADKDGKVNALGLAGAAKDYYKDAKNTRLVKAIAETMGFDVEEGFGKWMTGGLQLGTDFVLGAGLDALLIGGTRALYRSSAADALRARVGVPSVAEYVAKTDNAFVLEKMLNVPHEEAVFLADNVHSPKMYTDYWETSGKIWTPPSFGRSPLYGFLKKRPNGLSWNPDTRSIRTMRQYEKLTDPAASTVSKIRTMPMHAGPISLSEEASDFAFDKAYFAGIGGKAAAAHADKFTRLRAAAAQDPAKRSELYFEWQKFDSREGAIGQHLQALPPHDDGIGKRFQNQWKRNHADDVEPTRADEYDWYQRLFYKLPDEAQPQTGGHAYWGKKVEVTDAAGNIVGTQWEEFFRVLETRVGRGIQKEANAARKEVRGVAREARAARDKRLADAGMKAETGQPRTVTSEAGYKNKVVDIPAPGQKGAPVATSADRAAEAESFFVDEASDMRGSGGPTDERPDTFHPADVKEHLPGIMGEDETQLRYAYAYDEAQRRTLADNDVSVHPDSPRDMVDEAFKGVPDKNALWAHLADVLEERGLWKYEPPAGTPSSISVDAGIAREVATLQSAGYQTFGSHSGLKGDHSPTHPSRDMDGYIEFTSGADDSIISAAAEKHGLKVEGGTPRGEIAPPPTIEFEGKVFNRAKVEAELAKQKERRDRHQTAPSEFSDADFPGWLEENVTGDYIDRVPARDRNAFLAEEYGDAKEIAALAREEEMKVSEWREQMWDEHADEIVQGYAAKNPEAFHDLRADAESSFRSPAQSAEYLAAQKAVDRLEAIRASAKDAPAAQTSSTLIVKNPQGKGARGRWNKFVAELVDAKVPKTEAEIALESKAAAAQAKIDLAKQKATQMTTSVSGRAAPIGELEFAETVFPHYDDTILALMNSGPKAMRLALANRNAVIEKIDRGYRTLILSTMASMVGIPLFDEGLRTTLEFGINPVHLSKRLAKVWDEKLSQAIGNSPKLRAQYGDLMDLVSKPMWKYVDANDPAIAAAAKQMSGHFNATEQGLRIVRDWVSLYDEAIAKITDSPMMASKEVRAQAASDATQALKAQVRTDPVYMGGDGYKGYLHAQGVVPPEDLARLGMPDTIDEYVDSIGITAGRLMSNAKTERHLREGPKAVNAEDFKRDPAVRQAWGGVSYMSPEGQKRLALAAKMGERFGGNHPLAAKVVGGTMHPLESLFGVMDSVSAAQRKVTFTAAYDRYEQYLRTSFDDLPEEELQEAAIHYARIATRQLTYVAERALIEEEARRALMFLPAIRQGVGYWFKKAATNPYKSLALFNAWGQMTDVSMGEDLNLNLKPTGFVEQMNPFNPETFSLPIGAIPALTMDAAAIGWNVLGGGARNVPADVMRDVTGFTPGRPVMGWVDGLIYSATRMNRGAAAFYDEITNKSPGMQSINESRTKATAAWLVYDAMRTGKADPKRANEHSAEIEAIRNAYRFASPIGAMKRALPTITVPDDGTADFKDNKLGITVSSGKTLTIDLNKLSEASAAYLGVSEEYQKEEVLKAYPFYRPVALAYDLRGDVQLEYLSKHRWLIPLVTRKTSEKGDYVTLTGEEAQAFRVRGTPEWFANEINKQYLRVDKYVVRKAYDEGVAAVELQYEAALKKKFGGDYKRKLGKEQLAQLEEAQGTVSGITTLATRMDRFHDRFGDKYEKQLLANASTDDKRSLFKDRAEDADKPEFMRKPVWVKYIEATGGQLEGRAYKALSALWATGDTTARNYVRESEYYDDFQMRYAKEQEEAQSAKIRAATSTYKSGLTPEELYALGITPSAKTPDAVFEYLGAADDWRKKLDKTKVFSDEWKATYRASKSDLAKRRKGVGKDILAQNTLTLLARIGLANTNPEISSASSDGIPESRAQIDAQKRWGAVSADLKKYGNLVVRGNDAQATKAMKVLLTAYGAAASSPYPELKANADEAMRSWTWRVMLLAGKMARDDVTGAYNKWTTAPGFSAGSKYFDETGAWLKDIFYSVAYDKKQKRFYSPSFERQWEEANRAAGGNLLSDMMDPSR